MDIEIKSYIDRGPNLWFKGRDIAKMLGCGDTDQVIRLHDYEEAKKNLCCISRGQKCINEYVLSSLILRSKLKTAENFRKWVIRIVLPSIRKYGY